MPTEDLEIVQDNIDYFQKYFNFKILDDHFEIDDDSLADYSGGATQFDWKEVTLEMDSLNNFWALAKLVQIKKSKQTL